MQNFGQMGAPMQMGQDFQQQQQTGFDFGGFSQPMDMQFQPDFSQQQQNPWGAPAPNFNMD